MTSSYFPKPGLSFKDVSWQCLGFSPSGRCGAFPKGNRLRNPTQPGVSLEARTGGGAQPNLSAVNMGLSAASLFLSLLFIPKINCFLFQSPAKPDDGSSFMASSFNIFLFLLLSLQQSFNLGSNPILIFHFAFKTAQHEAVTSGLSHSCLHTANFAAPKSDPHIIYMGWAFQQAVALHQVTEVGLYLEGSFKKQEKQNPEHTLNDEAASRPPHRSVTRCLKPSASFISEQQSSGPRSNEGVDLMMTLLWQSPHAHKSRGAGGTASQGGMETAAFPPEAPAR